MDSPADETGFSNGGASEAAPDEATRSRVVLTTAVDSIITINAQGIISSLNPATLRMFGYAQDELLGRNVSMLMPQPYRDEHDQYLSRYLKTGEASIIGIGRRVTGRRKTGEEFPIHLAVSEFQENGTRFFTGIVRDLTELEQVQRQLLQSERLAAIGQMVTGLAHESRNALQRAQACLDMLSLDLEENSEQLGLTRRAMTALQDLYRLYEEVRSYASPIHLECRDCDLTAIWRKEWENLAATRADRKLYLDETLNCPSTRCEADVHRLEQVFRNVLENAIYVSPPGRRIRVVCGNTILNGQPALQVDICDDGPGLTPQIAQQIFEPFFTTKQKGTGLGMAIVHRIISAHHGTISAKSGSPGGAMIQIVLPVTAAFRSGSRPAH